jgi:hypothetical protein
VLSVSAFKKALSKAFCKADKKGRGLCQLQFKFKIVPDKYQQKIIQADADRLLTCGERILSASTLEDIFSDSH